MFHELIQALEESLFMIFASGLLVWLVGLPLSALLYTTQPDRFLESKGLYTALSTILNTTKSVPYIGLMIALIPFTRWLTGSEEGTLAAIIPLTLAGIPHFTQLATRALNRIPTGLIEASRSMGATPLQILYKVLLPEALPNMIHAISKTLIHIIGYSTIAGALGSGGLGYLLIIKGYQHFQMEYVVATLSLLLAMIYLIQLIGRYIVNNAEWALTE